MAGPAVKSKAFEVPPPGAGLNTVTLAVPAAAMSLAGIVAWTCVLLVTVVARAAPFQRTSAPSKKSLPFTVNVNPVLPATARGGERLVRVGAGFAAGDWNLTRLKLAVVPFAPKLRPLFS